MHTNYSNKRFLLLAALSGILLTLSWPERGFPFIIFFAFIPLLIIEESIQQNKNNISPFKFLLFSWIAFVLWNGLTTYWIVFATLPGAIMAVFINSFFMAIPMFLMHIIKRNMPTQHSLISLIVLWLSFEFLHMNWELSWSWLNLGNVFARYPQWVQWYEYTGILGGTMWILILNILLYSIIKFAIGIKVKPRFKKFIIIATIAFFTIPSIASFIIYYTYEEKYDPAEIVIVQPNFDSYEKVSSYNEAKKRMDLMLGNAKKNITSSTKFVVFPEAALPERIDINKPQDFYSIRRINDFLSDHDSLYLITGLMAYKFYGPNPDASPTARQHGSTPDYYDVFNASLITDKEGNYQFNSKSKLVPGVERMPYFKLFKPLEGLILNLGGIPGSMGYWEEQKPFYTKDSTIIYAPICYESIYGEYVNKYIVQGSELIFIITNDGWWRDTPGYRQHHQYARLRAIETRRSIARTASTGISSFINQKGIIQEASSWDEEIVLRNTLNKNQKLTFYSIHGDYIGRCSALIAILLLLYVIALKILAKQKNYLS